MEGQLTHAIIATARLRQYARQVTSYKVNGQRQLRVANTGRAPDFKAASRPGHSPDEFLSRNRLFPSSRAMLRTATSKTLAASSVCFFAGYSVYRYKTQSLARETAASESPQPWQAAAAAPPPPLTTHQAYPRLTYHILTCCSYKQNDCKSQLPGTFIPSLQALCFDCIFSLFSFSCFAQSLCFSLLHCLGYTLLMKHSTNSQTLFAVPLSCDGCVKSVSDALYSLGGITKVEGNLKDQLIAVEGSGTFHPVATRRPKKPGRHTRFPSHPRPLHVRNKRERS